MTKRERKLLAPLITSVARSNRNAWRELKRQIFDWGNSEHYPAQHDFSRAAQFLVQTMPEKTRLQIIREWKIAKPRRPDLPDAEILDSLPMVIIDEVVKRAKKAAYRTQ